MKTTILHKIPRSRYIPLILILLFHLGVYYIPMSLALNWPHYDLTTALDRAVPVIPAFIVPYFLSYFFWLTFYLYMATLDSKSFYRIFAVTLISHIIAGVVFLALPTTIERPVVEGTDIFSRLLLDLYKADPPANLLPSMHCYTSWICYMGVRGRQDVPRWYRRFCLVSAIIIFISTQVTKQHYLLDLVAGLALVELVSAVVKLTHIPGSLQRLFERSRRPRRIKSA